MSEEIDIDVTAEDAADYFATVLKERFPEVLLEPLEVPFWRKGWRIILPPQFEQKGELVAFVQILRDSLYWNKDMLLAYEIVQHE